MLNWQRKIIVSFLHLKNMVQVIVSSKIIITSYLKLQQMVLNVELAKTIIGSLLPLENMNQVKVLTQISSIARYNFRIWFQNWPRKSQTACHTLTGIQIVGQSNTDKGTGLKLSIQLIQVPKYCLEAVRSEQPIRNEHVNLCKLKIMLEILAECFFLVYFCSDENALLSQNYLSQN